MFKTVRIIKRPNREIPFFHEVSPPTKERQLRYYEKYIKTGKSIKSDFSLSDDQLTVTLISEWDTKESFIDFITDSDPILNTWTNGMNQYIEQHRFIDHITFDDQTANNFYQLPHIFVVFRPGAAGNFLSGLIDNVDSHNLGKILLSSGGHAHYNSIVERKKLGIDHISLGMGIAGVDQHFFSDDEKVEFYREKINSTNYENKRYVTWTHNFTNIPLYKKLFPACKILVIKEDTLRERLVSMIMAINKNHFSKDQQMPIPPLDRIKPEIYKKTFISNNFLKYYPNKIYKVGHDDVDKHVMYQSHLECQGLANYNQSLLDRKIDYLDDNKNPSLTFFERRAQHSIGFHHSENVDHHIRLLDILSANTDNIIHAIEFLLDRSVNVAEKAYIIESVVNYKNSQDQCLLKDPYEYLFLTKEKADNIVSAFDPC